jgi:hypothetical protein
LKAYDDALAMLRSIRAVPEDLNANIKLRAQSNKSPKKIKIKKLPPVITATQINNEDLESVHEPESAVLKDAMNSNRESNSDVFINTRAN